LRNAWSDVPAGRRTRGVARSEQTSTLAVWLPPTDVEAYL
jgi:hypothetical protein